MDSTQLLKGVLDTAVLAVLSRGRTYGYDLVRQLRAGGFDEVGDASVYGTLRRLFGGGYLTSEVVPSEEGPARKYYGLNQAGADQLDRSKKVWHEFTGVMNHLLEGEEE
ncbi:MAG: PadR family transcriptional regulator [Acidimicrobiia bacterium]